MRPHKPRMFCIACGYPLDSAAGSACSECGRAYVAEDSATWLGDDPARFADAARRLWRPLALFGVLLLVCAIVISIWFVALGLLLLVPALSVLGFVIVWSPLLDPILKRDQGHPRSWREKNETAALAGLVGQEAVATQVLRPAGDVRINDQTYRARCEVGMVEVGGRVTVMAVKRRELIVRPADAP